MRARRSYDQKPWINSSFSMNLKRDSVKSDAITACIPSWPEMPTPTSAIWIIDTSFAPSPMANVLRRSSSLTIFTKNAFCNGVERQQRTQAQCWVNFKNGFVRFDLRRIEGSFDLGFWQFVAEGFVVVTSNPIWMLTFFHRRPMPDSWPLRGLLYWISSYRFRTNRMWYMIRPSLSIARWVWNWKADTFSWDHRWNEWNVIKLPQQFHIGLEQFRRISNVYSSFRFIAGQHPNGDSLKRKENTKWLRMTSSQCSAPTQILTGLS